MGARHSRQNSKCAPTAALSTTDQQENYNNSSCCSSIKNSVTRTRSTPSSIVVEGRQYHQEAASTYALPRDEIEQDRLNSQHFSLKALFDGNILASVRNRLPPNAQVLDIGCGSGCWVMEMAIDYPHFQFTGLDMADMFPTTIRPENIKFQLHNVLHGLPFPDNSFDFIHMRLLIIAFQKNDWPRVLSEIHRVLKPGGIVQLMESDFTEKANIPSVERFNNEFLKAMLDLGQDPWIGSKLTHLLADQHFEIVELKEKYLDYSLPLSPISREMLINWKDAMLSIRPMLAHRFEPTDYNSVVDQYIEGITQAGWKVKMWAVCGQKQK